MSKVPLKMTWAVGNDEFIVDGQAIHDSWATAWPQAIARAWNIEHTAGTNWTKAHDNDLATIISNTIEYLTTGKMKKPMTNERKDELLKKYGKVIQPGKEINEILDKSDFILLKDFYMDILTHDTDMKIVKGIDTDDFIWYKKLLCHKSEMVLEALEEEGFIIDAMENPPKDFEKNLSSRVIVRKWFQEYKVLPKRKEPAPYKKTTKRIHRLSVSYSPNNQQNPQITPLSGSRENGWKDVDGLGHVLVLTLPLCPKDAMLFGLAVTDYEAAGKVYPFTMCCC